MWIELLLLTSSGLQVEIPISAFLERNLFGIRRASAPSLEPEIDGCLAVFGPRLVATIVGSRPKAMFAVSDGVVWAEAGETVGGATIRSVERGRVEIWRGAACGVVSFDGPALSPESPPPERALVRRTASGEVNVRRADIEDILEDPSRVLGEARIVPKVAGGDLIGFAVHAIRPGGIAEQLGLQNGDVIERINGRRIVDVGMGFSAELLGSRELAVDYQRRGRPMSLTIILE